MRWDTLGAFGLCGIIPTMLWRFWKKNPQVILLRIKTPDKTPFLFSAVYANPRLERRRELWDVLRDWHLRFEEPWLLARDFDEILSVDEKKGGAPVDLGRCSEFAAALDDCQLMDMGSYGPLFTWKGPKFAHLNRVFKRLDRVVANVNWRNAYEEAVIKILPRTCSDHNPLLICLSPANCDWEERPFRFFPP
ncbi:uncharacterized protein LOC133286684 [Gastrolobium bilobum]|uniref:uncharacterized protein LOC133286684 n=1 Tax=Gastrolobium bilobum TaxID=150636 RepID=UPI002AB2FD7A|nr:uncharacterized protein LOC133286684 [Gastrolobium bilobum]